MEKIGLLTRENIVSQVKQKIEGSRGYFFVGFNKIEAFAFNNLRNSLIDVGAQVFVTKNSLFKRAFIELGKEGLNDFFEAETGIIFAYDEDVVKACKTLTDFSKENEFLKIKGAFVENKKITAKEVSALAKLPSREALLGMALSVMVSPLTGFLNSLNQIILKFVWVVKEIKKKKEQQQ
ncbi:MAG: 50S ribosomal protein L10 [Candidatus Omnitrophota bacterium]